MQGMRTLYLCSLCRRRTSVSLRSHVLNTPRWERKYRQCMGLQTGALATNDATPSTDSVEWRARYTSLKMYQLFCIALMGCINSSYSRDTSSRELTSQCPGQHPLLSRVYYIQRVVRLNTLRAKHNSRRFPDDIFKYIFVNENVPISRKISLKFIPKVWINNIQALVQIMAWCRPGDNPLSEPMLGKSKSKSKKTLFNVGQCKQYNISSHLKWVLVADKFTEAYVSLGLNGLTILLDYVINFATSLVC